MSLFWFGERVESIDAGEALVRQQGISVCHRNARNEFQYHMFAPFARMQCDHLMPSYRVWSFFSLAFNVHVSRVRVMG